MICRTMKNGISGLRKIVGAQTIPWSDVQLASTTTAETSSTMALLTLFLPLPSRTLSCSVCPNFIIMFLRVPSDISLRSCLFRSCGSAVWLEVLTSAMSAFCSDQLIKAWKISFFYFGQNFHMLLQCCASQRHLILII